MFLEFIPSTLMSLFCDLGSDGPCLDVTVGRVINQISSPKGRIAVDFLEVGSNKQPDTSSIRSSI
jgi:hypothetical protein